MTTATTNTVVDHSSDAGFRTWAAEVITMLVTTLGLTQTADTGQINTSTVTRPGTNTAGGYVILRFNDTAQATSPVFIKLEFGTGGSTTTPMMWITVATGSNGSGTLTGTVMTRVAVANANVPSTSTPFTTRGCYSTAAGSLGFAWKINGGPSTNVSLGGFFIYRSADSTGTVTTDAVALLTNSGSNSPSNTQGALQAISYLASTAYFSTGNLNWGFVPFLVTGTLFGGNAQVMPVFQYTPVLGISPWLALAILAEIGLNSTAVIALVGATTHTFIQVGSALGTNNMAAQGLSNATYGMMMLWE